VKTHLDTLKNNSYSFFIFIFLVLTPVNIVIHDENIIHSLAFDQDYVSATLSYLMQGEDNPHYNAKEYQHMQDVRFLYYTQLIIWMFSIIIVCCGYSHTRAITATIAVVAFMTFILIFILIDFKSFWLLFHKLFFTNDLWLMDPRTDKLVRVFNEIFFTKLNIIIASFMILMSIVIGGLSWNAKTKKKI
jgi:integral membrane protein (TIGR01906 family)